MPFQVQICKEGFFNNDFSKVKPNQYEKNQLAIFCKKNMLHFKTKNEKKLFFFWENGA